MKFGVFVCILVVLAIHEGVSHIRNDNPIFYPALVEGNCKKEDIPRRDLYTCTSIKCDKAATGAISYTITLCPLTVCANGKAIGHGEPNGPGVYPNCCAKETCD